MRVEDMQPGQSGYTDPWNLAEVSRPTTPYKPTMEPGERIPPPPDPHTGVFQLLMLGQVEPSATSDHFMPVRRDDHGSIVVDLSGVKLNSPPRLEASAHLGGKYMPVNVLGLAEALRPPAAPAE